MGDLTDPVTVYYSSNTTHDEDSVAEETVLSFIELKSKIELHIDVNNLTLDTVIKGKEEVDGTNLRIFYNKTYSLTNEDSDYDDDVKDIIIIIDGSGRDATITFTSSAATGSADVTVPVQIVETSR